MTWTTLRPVHVDYLFLQVQGSGVLCAAEWEALRAELTCERVPQVLGNNLPKLT